MTPALDNGKEGCGELKWDELVLGECCASTAQRTANRTDWSQNSLNVELETLELVSVTLL